MAQFNKNTHQYLDQTKTLFEELLHKATSGPTWLGHPEIRQILINQLHEGDGSLFRLDAFSIMSNHFHLVMKPREIDIPSAAAGLGIQTYSEIELATIMKAIKGPTARQANTILKRVGPFWDAESFDRSLRDGEEHFNAIRYSLMNPVKAGLVKRWRDWPGNYLSEEMQSRFPYL